MIRLEQARLPRVFLSALVLLGCGLCLSLSGCGKKSDTSTVEGEEDTPEEGGDVQVASTSGSRKTTRRPERPKIGDIPLDVWFDNPLEIASNTKKVNQAVAVATPQQTVPTPATNPATDPKPNPTPMPSTTPAPAVAAGGGWNTIISAEIIGDETKQIRSRLTDSLQSVGKYNGNYKDVIQVDGAVMAALAGILQTHPESLTWKPDAKFVRDTASEVSKKAKGLGQASFEPTKLAFEQMEGLLSGNKPPGLPESGEKVVFSEVASRTAIMKRMQKAFEWMKSNINSESIFQKEGPKIAHEATILAAMAKVIMAEGYASTDEKEYQKFAETMIKANLDITAAVKNADFKAFSDALSKSQKACDECHQDYRFAGG